MRVNLAELNPPQLEAVTTTEGPLLVLAGAGSGKTRVITFRIAHLLSRGVRPDNILAVSFTNKAADEMRERVGRLVPGRLARGLTLSTFHSLGLLILKAERKSLGFPGGFTIYDTADQLGVIRDILRDAHIEDRRLDPKAILMRISRAKNANLTPEQLIAQLKKARMVPEYDGYAAEVYPRYQAKMRGFHALDFDDLLVETLRLMQEHEDLRARWQQRFRYLMIDEYQDTNRCQLDLLRLLCEPHRNLAVVGDDDQSIYGWRGAEASNILEFDRQFPGAKVVKLEENYRSTRPILQAANAVIAKNQKRRDKTLWTRKAEGEPLQLVVAEDGEAEARFVAEEIDLLRAQRRYDLQDMAVLYRSNVQGKLLEEELRAAQIDYRVIGGQAFFDRKEVKDAIAYLRLLTHPRDEISLRRVINYPARGIGAQTLESLSAAQKAWHPGHKGEHPPLLDLLGVVSEQRQGSLLDGAPMTGGGAKVPPTAHKALSDIAPRVRGAIGGFLGVVERFRGRFREGAGWAAMAKDFMTEVGVFDDLIKAGPTPLAAQRRIRNLESFIESLGRYEERARGQQVVPSLETYLHRFSLQTNDDDADDVEGNKVVLSTLHGAKGLEFKVVFLVGLEEELLPHKKTLYPSETDLSEVGAALDNPGGGVDVSEERRLFYVGITRARERLYLSRARFRGSKTIERPRAPSRFLEDLPASLCVQREAGGPPIAGEEFDEEQFARQQLEKMLKMTQ